MTKKTPTIRTDPVDEAGFDALLKSMNWEDRLKKARAQRAEVLAEREKSGAAPRPRTANAFADIPPPLFDPEPPELIDEAELAAKAANMPEPEEVEDADEDQGQFLVLTNPELPVELPGTPAVPLVSEDDLEDMADAPDPVEEEETEVSDLAEEAAPAVVYEFIPGSRPETKARPTDAPGPEPEPQEEVVAEPTETALAPEPEPEPEPEP
ncbi:MAG: hypothetical protein KJO15_04040, partial [Alphaproteobacteria bacterium]|nr:hypothetical protein [Alphaproteobacteria bacterium]